jgi:hypothetical protein
MGAKQPNFDITRCNSLRDNGGAKQGCNAISAISQVTEK